MTINVPKPTPPKRPLTAVSEEAIIVPDGSITLNDLRELREAIYGAPQEAGALISKVEKPKFVRRPHLTDRPFRAHEGLLALQKQMEDSKPARQGQRRNNKEKK